MSSPEQANTVYSISSNPSNPTSNMYQNPENECEPLDEENDDDMEFEPTADSEEDLEFFDPAEDLEADFHDADDGLSGVEIEFTTHGDSTLQQNVSDIRARDNRPTPASTARATAGRIQVTHNQIMQLFGHSGLRSLFTNHRRTAPGFGPMDEENEEDGAEDRYGSLGGRRRRQTRARDRKPPPVPSKEGTKLMASGIFGESDYYADTFRKKKPRLARSLMYRELGNARAQPARSNNLISQGLIPSSNADTIIHYNSRCYSGQFSDDGNFFFSCAQDFKIRMYDTSNPYKWKYYKTAVYPYGQWTITDATLSPDNKYLAYSSIRSIVCLAPTNPGETGEPWLLDFSDTGERNSRHRFNGGYSHFGIWSIRFSGDGREIVAGTSDHSVYVYDIESRKWVLRIAGHNDDVNAVCFGDTSSPHILYSGSDDTLIKVWDRRSMGDSREAGVFMGHTEGLTYVDSKGDGRYVLSNGKDQCMKLWDLRKMMPTEKASRLNPAQYTTGFDYRFMDFSESDRRPHPHDCSLVTFHGHRVLKTLIRCHFSPPGSTDSRYVYSGSEDGSVYIYNLDATIAGKIDVNRATYHSRPKDPYLYGNQYEINDRRSTNAWKTCVRDASWHPSAPVVAATSWNGWGMSTGTCTLHSWNDGADDDEADPKMGQRVDQRLDEDEDLYDHSQRQNARASHFRSRLRTQRVEPANDEERGEW